MVGWHQRLDGCESEQASGDGDGRGSLVCCSPRGCKEAEKTELLNCLTRSAKGVPGRKAPGTGCNLPRVKEW